MAVPEPFPFRVSDTVRKGSAHVLNHKIFKKNLLQEPEIYRNRFSINRLLYILLSSRPSFIEKEKKEKK